MAHGEKLTMRFLTRYQNRIMSLALSAVLILSMATGCGKGNETSPTPEITNTPAATSTPVPTNTPVAKVDDIDDNYRVFYEIFTGAFSDSNGDGIGDIMGICYRMDYLNDGNINSGRSLGVQGLWLTPIFKSPSYHKYDAEDYYKIDEKFGTLQEFQFLLELAHERNVKVIIDLAINHSSSSNQWFKDFVTAHRNKDTENEYYDFYSWVKAEDRKSGIAYKLIPGTTDEYYECNFSEDMPEFNFDNPAVRQEVVNIAKYWLDIGVDGFRFDAIKYVYYNDTKASVEFWDWYMKELKALKPDIYCVGECWSGQNEVVEYLPALNCFDFTAAQAEGVIAGAAKGDDIKAFTRYIQNYQKKVDAAGSDAMMNLFISNHDMDRSAGYLMMANKYNFMAANIYLLCSGSPFIYYGEEIGMKGNRGGAATDANRRLAMLWGDGDSVKNPVGSTYQASKQTNGVVADQIENPDSLLNYYGRVIALRNQFPAIARGSYTAVTVDNSSTVGGFEISYNGEKILLMHNTSTEEKTIDLSALGLSMSPQEIGGYVGQGSASLSGSQLTLGPQTSVIVK